MSTPATGLSDLRADHGFFTFRKMQRWTLSTTARVELLDRLLEENHRRARNDLPVPPPSNGADVAVDDNEDGVLFR